MEAKQEIRKQPRRNAEQWSKLIAAWQSSGQARKAWCQQQGIAYESLRRWVKRLRGSADRLPFVEIHKASQALDAAEQARARVAGTEISSFMETSARSLCAKCCG